MILTRDSEPWNHVVGIDPGGTTGLWACHLGGIRFDRLDLRIAGGKVFSGELQVGSVGADRSIGRGGPLHIQEARFVRSLAGRLASLAEAWGVSECLHLAIESFVIRERSMDESLLSPVRLTSGLLALLEEDLELNVVVHFNSASDAKSTVSDRVLKRLGVYVAGQGHAMDAARHAILTMRKELR